MKCPPKDSLDQTMRGWLGGLLPLSGPCLELVRKQRTCKTTATVCEAKVRAGQSQYANGMANSWKHLWCTKPKAGKWKTHCPFFGREPHSWRSSRASCYQASFARLQDFRSRFVPFACGITYRGPGTVLDRKPHTPALISVCGPENYPRPNSRLESLIPATFRRSPVAHTLSIRSSVETPRHHTKRVLRMQLTVCVCLRTSDGSVSDFVLLQPAHPWQQIRP